MILRECDLKPFVIIARRLGPRLNGYGYPTIIGPEPSLRYPGSLVSGLESLVSGLGSLVEVP